MALTVFNVIHFTGGLNTGQASYNVLGFEGDVREAPSSEAFVDVVVIDLFPQGTVASYDILEVAIASLNPYKKASPLVLPARGIPLAATDIVGIHWGLIEGDVVAGLESYSGAPIAATGPAWATVPLGAIQNGSGGPAGADAGDIIVAPTSPPVGLKSCRYESHHMVTQDGQRIVWAPGQMRVSGPAQLVVFGPSMTPAAAGTDALVGVEELTVTCRSQSVQHAGHASSSVSPLPPRQ